MGTEKSIAISFRITPRLKRLFEAAASHERRSLTNMLEVLVEDYCARNGLEVDQADSAHTNQISGNKSE